MKKTIVVYQSKYGTTKQYAEWIAEALDCPCKSIKDANAKELAGYDTVVYGGALYAGNINGIRFVRKHYGEWKHTVVFIVGAMPVGLDDKVSAYIERNFGGRPQGMDYYYMSGKLDYETMSVTHKMMMNMMKKMIGKKPEAERTEIEKGLMESIRSAVDRTDRSLVEPLVARVRAHIADTL